jgi:rare lipoprotein A
MKKIRIAILAIILATLTTNSWAMQASWYSKADLIRDGQDKITHFIMANGKEFKDEGKTCASWDFKLGTSVRITNNGNGKSVIVTVTDRTARRFKGKRIDLSKGAFSKIADCKQGIVSVSVEEAK